MKPKPLKLDQRSSSTNPAGRNLLIQSVRSQDPYKATNSKKWNPNSFLPNLLAKNEVPMHDGQLTPRGVKKAMTLDRGFDHHPWIYNRSTCDRFDGDTVASDKVKAKMLRKKLRQMRRSSMKRGESNTTLANASKNTGHRSGSLTASRTNASR